MIDKSIFKNLKANYQKLLEFGFVEQNGIFTLSKDICNSEFVVKITVQNENDVTIDVFDNSTNEKLALFYVADATGAFVGKINTKCQIIIHNIINNCFEKNVYKSAITQQLISYVREKYNDELEFLWQKFPEYAVWRRKNNKKWYGILMVISKKKLNIDSDEQIEILDVRADKTVNTLVDNTHIFEGYHMNKKNWITLCLDGSIPFNKVCEFIDKSYNLANKK